MHLTYDRQVDMAYLWIVDDIRPGEAADAIELLAGDTELPDDLVVDFDEAGNLLGIEIFNARAWLRAEVLEQAETATARRSTGDDP